MDYNITFRQKDKGWQFIISQKIGKKWKQVKSKQGFKTKKEAKDYSEKVLEELKKNSDVLEEYMDLTIGELKKDYLRHIELHREYNTYKVYEQSLRYFNIDNVEVTKLRTSDVQKCLDCLIDNYSVSTINKRISTFKSMLNYCYRQYDIKIPNLSNLTLPKSKDKKQKVALEPSTQNELLDYFSKSKSKDYYITILLALTCGLRIGEICGLTWQDINLKEATLNINKQWKKDKTTKQYVFGELKSKESYRSVPIPKIALDELKKIKDERYKNIIYISYQKDRIILNASTESFNINLDKKLTKKYGISIHELRHTYATNLIAGGLDFKTTAKLLGHNVEQTMKTYSHVTKKMFDEATKLVNKIY